MRFRCLTPGFLVWLVLSTAGSCCARHSTIDAPATLAYRISQSSSPPESRNENGGATGTSYRYKFENERFYISVIEIDLAADGSGNLKFKRGESDDSIEMSLKVLPGTLERINRLTDRLSFLTAEDAYQSKKDFSHLGWMTVTARRGDLERTVRFNYSTNPSISEMDRIFRGIATQEIDLFDLDLALKHQPLETPRILETIETDLRLERVAEPERLAVALREIAGDDTLPLIARNHATRIVSAIQKGKYKGPQRSGK
jgi:hypothetical protein